MIDVGDPDLGRAALTQQLHVFHADVTEALHGELVFANFFITELAVQRCHQTLQRAVRREWRWIARTTVNLMHARDVFRFAVDIFHVVDIDANVFCRDVTAAERIDELTEGAEQRFGLVLGRITDDDCLTAADVEASNGVFVSHAAAQTQNVIQRLSFRLVRPHARATQRRTQHRIVDGDDRLQSRVLVMAKNNLFVTSRIERFKNHDFSAVCIRMGGFTKEPLF